MLTVHAPIAGVYHVHVRLLIPVIALADLRATVTVIKAKTDQSRSPGSGFFITPHH